jgi:hypothetical protein
MIYADPRFLLSIKFNDGISEQIHKGRQTCIGLPAYLIRYCIIVSKHRFSLLLVASPTSSTFLYDYIDKCEVISGINQRPIPFTSW